MAHDFSSVTDMANRAAGHANNGQNQVDSVHDEHLRPLRDAIKEVGEGVKVLADAVNFLCQKLNEG